MAWVTIAILVGSALIQAGVAYYQSRKANEDIEETERQDPTLPRVTESDPIPVVWGTVRIRGANVVWWGNQEEVSNEREAISIHLALCQGPIDEVAAVHIGEKRGVNLDYDEGTGATTVTSSWDVSSGVVAITGDAIKHYESTALGGVHRTDITQIERIYFMPGQPTQVAPADMTGSGGLDDTLPGYRGVFSVWARLTWFPQVTSQIDVISLTVRRRSKTSYNATQWQSALAAPNDTDMNPAHIIREILTDEQWGAALPASRIDETSFAASAQTLFDEGFGLSGIWGRTEKYGAKINEILSHINAVSYEERTTGKIVLKLIRDDYDATAIPLITAEHVRSIRRTRPQPWELVNQLTVKYSSREVDRMRTVPANDTAAQSVRGIVADSVTYAMVYDGELAAKLAARDLLTMGSPLTNLRLSLAPSVAKDLRPGDVFTLTHTDEGIDQMVVRVVDMMEPQDNSADSSIVVEGVEDAFAFADGISTPPVDIDITPQNISPLPADDQVGFELPYWLAVQWSWDAGIWDDGLNESDRSRMALAAYTASGSQIDFSLDSNGVVREDRRGFAQRVDIKLGTFGYNIEAETSSVVFSFDDATALTDPFGTKTHLVYFPASEMTGVDGAAKPLFGYINVTTSAEEVHFGLFDTVPPLLTPKNISGWVLGPIDWGVEPEVNRDYAVDPTLHADASTVSMKALTRTLLGSLDREQAPATKITGGKRTLLPYPPGQIRVDGTNDKPTSTGGSIDLNWKSRWRLGDQVKQGDASVAAPTGHDTVITIYDYDGTTFTQLRTATVAMSTETYTYMNSDEESDRVAAGLPSTLGDLVFEVEGKRDGLLSFTANTRLYDRA